MSLDRLHEVLTLELPPFNDPETNDQLNTAKVLIAAATAGLNFQSKVDDTALRRQNTEILPKLLEALNVERARLTIELSPGEHRETLVG